MSNYHPTAEPTGGSGAPENRIASVHLKDASGNAIPRSVKKRFWFIAAALLVLLLGIGVMAKNGWMPNTEPGRANQRVG